MEALLQTKNLSKNYSGENSLKNINLTLEKGKIVGLLGPNGSGKTTFIKLIAGILAKTKGEILIDNIQPGVETKKIVSYLPDVNHLYKWMKVKDAINFYKDFFEDFDDKKALNLLEYMKLNPDDKVSKLSKGMIERLTLILTLSRNAKVYLLDEPLGGVDPVAREKIINLIRDNFNQDSLIIVSTHLVNDIEKLFDQVVFLKQGEVIINQDADQLRAEKGMSVDQVFREVYE